MNTRLTLSSLLAGVVFGLGLAVSGLADPDKVLQFLRLDSHWSGLLLITMASGIAVTWLGYRLVLRRGPVFEKEAQLPGSGSVDKRLLAGAAIFGAGWGLAGFCPGPAVTSLVAGNPEPWLFVVAMLTGFKLQEWTS